MCVLSNLVLRSKMSGAIVNCRTSGLVAPIVSWAVRDPSQSPRPMRCSRLASWPCTHSQGRMRVAARAQLGMSGTAGDLVMLVHPPPFPSMPLQPTACDALPASNPSLSVRAAHAEPASTVMPTEWCAYMLTVTRSSKRLHFNLHLMLQLSVTSCCGWSGFSGQWGCEVCRAAAMSSRGSS